MLRQAEKQLEGKISAGYTLQLPPELKYIWDLFLNLNETRTAGFGPNPIQFAEMESWARLHHVELDTWEIDTLRRMDHIWMLVVKAKTTPKKK